MRYRNVTGLPLIVKGVGEVMPGKEFETDLPVKHRGVVVVEKKAPTKKDGE